MSGCGAEHPFDPDGRFCCKMKYMRANGVGVQRPGELFRSGTLKEHAESLQATARANGYDPVPVGERWV